MHSRWACSACYFLCFDVGWYRRFGVTYSLCPPVSRNYVQLKTSSLTVFARSFLTHDVYNAFALINSNLPCKITVFLLNTHLIQAECTNICYDILEQVLNHLNWPVLVGLEYTYTSGASLRKKKNSYSPEHKKISFRYPVIRRNRKVWAPLRVKGEAYSEST